MSDDENGGWFGAGWAEYPPGGDKGPEFWLSVALNTRPALLAQLRLHDCRVSQRVH